MDQNCDLCKFCDIDEFDNNLFYCNKHKKVQKKEPFVIHYCKEFEDKWGVNIHTAEGDCIHKLGCGYIHSAKCNDYQKCNNYKIREENMNSKELKMGDKVEVFHSRGIAGISSWDTKIFIKYGEADSIIVVANGYDFCFYGGKPFNTTQTSSWRIPKEKTYRHFTWEERDQLRGKWIKPKTSNNEFLIYGFRAPDAIEITKSVFVTFEGLFNHYTFLDGSPVGVEII